VTTGISIRCILGKIVSLDANVDVSKAGSNSSKWIFDVEQDTTLSPEFHFELLDSKTHTIKTTEFLSPGVMPLNTLAAQAHIYMPEPKLPTLCIAADNVGVIRYRVTLDTVHSLGR
jgi:hypothetical protein